MTPEQFITKWSQSQTKERSAAQEHFVDLCRLLGQPTPNEADPTGDWYCFERGAAKTGAGQGWADVWKKGCFGWEYKGKGKDLGAALRQLQLYALALQSPPLLIVCDIDSIVIHTAFTNAVQETHVVPLEALRDPQSLQRLTWAFTDPEKLRPGLTTPELTEKAAGRFAALAQTLQLRGHDPQRVAPFLNKLLFCLFAEDVRLLPDQLFTKLLTHGIKAPGQVEPALKGLFAAMSTGGLFGYQAIDWFNGGLFASDHTLPLEPADLESLLEVSRLDWSCIEPAIFGTLFERGLDPAKRSQLGAHYTDRHSILRIIDPVIRQPLLEAWHRTRGEIAADKSKTRKKAQAAYHRFLDSLRDFRVLDPACGSGNFLYLALRTLKDIEHQVILEAETLGLPAQFPAVGPESVHGIEINPYAAELARVTVWIGEIQWMLEHGRSLSRNPVLRPLDTIECRDALLNPDGTEAEWPKADVIVGNPPFLGGSKKRGQLGDAMFEAINAVYAGRVPGGADLVCYWFEKARAHIAAGQCQAAGLVATNSIRGGSNRKVLERIVDATPIFTAWSDEPWINEGAAVRVSLVCFGSVGWVERTRETRQTPAAVAGFPLRCNPAYLNILNGQPVAVIHADLTGSDHQVNLSVDVSQASRIEGNRGVALEGMRKDGPFDLAGEIARRWLNEPNPHGRSNSEVLKPRINGKELTGRPADVWVIDFGSMPLEAASLFASPFEYVTRVVKPIRDVNRDTQRRTRWWQFGRSNEELRGKVFGLHRVIVTARVSKHRLFAWLDHRYSADTALVVIARADDTTFGILHSRFHELWSLRMGTSLEDRPRYTPTTTFETFPFPDGLTPADTRHVHVAQPSGRRTEPPSAGLVPGIAEGARLLQAGIAQRAGLLPATPVLPDLADPTRLPVAEAIARAAFELNRLRQAWLNPPDWVDWVITPEEEQAGFPPRPVAKPGGEAGLKQRTLTNLYNARPAWLAMAHETLDTAVAAAYGWADYTRDMADEDILRRLLALNQARAKP